MHVPLFIFEWKCTTSVPYITQYQKYFFCHLSVGENIETNEDIANDNTIADTSSSSSEGIVLVFTAC